MAIKIVVGAAGSGKTAYCYEQIAAALQEVAYHPLIMLVPDQFNLATQSALCKKLAPGILRVEVLGFNSLAERVLKETGGDQLPRIDDLERIMILRRLLERHKKDLTFFYKGYQAQGFMDALNQFFTVLEQNQIQIDTIAALQNEPEVPSLFQCKLEDLKNMYQWFWEYVGTHFTTAEKTLEAVRHYLGESSYLTGTSIWVDGFYGFTGNQLAILIELGKKVEELVITLPLDRVYGKQEAVTEANPLYESIKVYQQLCERCAEAGIEVTTHLLQKEKGEGEGTALDYLESQYLQAYVKPYPEAQESIYTTIYKNKQEEVEAVAREMCRLVREASYRYRDMVIMIGDMSSYQSTVTQVLAQYNIPYFLDRKKSIHTNSFISMMLGVFEVMRTGWSYKSVMHLLRTEMLPVAVEEVDRLENYLLAFGIKGKKKWQAPFEYTSEQVTPEWLEDVRVRITQPIFALEQRLKVARKQIGRLTVHAVSVALYTFLEEINAYEILEERIAYGKEMGRLEAEKENSQLWDKVVEVLERMVAILGDETTTVTEYSLMLQASFSYLQMGLIPLANDQVLVGTIDRTRLANTKAIFVLGANEGVIPKLTESGELFSQVDKVTLEKLCKGQGYEKDRLHEVLIHNPKHGTNFAIYSILTRAEDRLYVSCVQADEVGKAMRPSTVFHKLKRMYDTPLVGESGALAYTHGVEPAFSYVAGKLKEYGKKQDLTQVEEADWKDLLSWYVGQESWQVRLDQVKRYMTFTNQQHYLSREIIPLLYADRLETSISKLETFRSCPTCYFMQYGLKVEERKILEWNMADIGTLFHGVLEQYPKELAAHEVDWVDVTPTVQKKCISTAIEKTLRQNGKNVYGPGRMKYTVDQLEKMSTRAINALTVQLEKGAFVPVAYELNFGKGELLPIEIAINDHQSLLIRGQIDRVDVYHKEGSTSDYVKIMDYKSGNKDFSLIEVYYGLQMQLLLYLDAYLKQTAHTLPAGVFYFHISGKRINYKPGMGEEALSEERQKQYKLSGILLDDLEIIKGMDETVSGEIVPVKLNKNGTLSAGSSVASMEQFDQLRSYLIDMMRSLGGEILAGKVSARPYQYKQKSPCNYCKYLAICQFEEGQEHNEIECLPGMKKEQVWEKIAKKEGGIQHGMDEGTANSN